MALLCVAIHLSIQIHVQQQAESLIHQWGEDAGVEIGDVRYHLLRNGLILQDIRLSRDKDTLSIKHMFIRANPKLLTGSSPQIGHAEITGFGAVLWNPERSAAWQSDQKLMRLWKATRTLLISKGSLTLHLKGLNDPAITLNAVSLEQDVQKGIRKITASARLAGAPLKYHSLSYDNPLEQHQWMVKGSLDWLNIDSELISSALGVSKTSGILSGQTSWTINKQANTIIQGKAELADTINTPSTQQLSWSGKQSDGNWNIVTESSAWPVQPWAENLPAYADKQLKHGLLDAKLHWRQQEGRWRLSTAQASLHHVSYAGKDDEENHVQPWTWQEINIKDLRLNFAKRKAHASSITTNNSSLIIPLTDSPAIATPAPLNNTIRWDISADKIDIKEMNLGLAMHDGKVLLPALKGRASWSLDNKIDFNLRSMKQTAKRELQEKETAEWRLAGQALYKHGNIDKSRFNLRGKGVDLALLRPFIPFQGSSDTGLSLAGATALNLNVTVADGIWRAQGKAFANNVSLSHAGDTWKADRVETRFGPLGMGLKAQTVDLLHASGWHYITALKPLPPYTTGPQAGRTQASWWAQDLRSLNWQIKQLKWNDGTISIGNSDVIWAESLDVEIAQLKPEHWANVSARGLLGEGDFSLKGRWYALADTQRFKGKATLDNSLPFFLHDWMLISGMPRLVHGRLSAAITIADGDELNSYKSHVKLQLEKTVAETTVSSQDPMLALTGFNTSGLLNRLSNNSIISLSFENQGDWGHQPPGFNQLSISMQQALHQAATASDNHKNISNKKKAGIPDPVIETRIRLREKGSLSLNERIRLRTALRSLARRKGWTLDLIPKWTGERLDAATVTRIRYTQTLIERFMTRQQNIPKSKIYPTWPTAKDHADEIGSIWVTLTPPD